jgi:hypothetical protein
MRSAVSKKLCRKTVFGSAIIATVVLCSWLAPSPIEARPQYKSAFERLYGRGKARITCDFCHAKGEKSKKPVNHYAKDLAKALGEKNVKDPSRIQDALRDIEGKSCTGGRSYIERMRAGYYPCPHGAQPEDPDGHRSIIDRYLAAPEDD